MAVKHIDLDDCYNVKTGDQEIVVTVDVGDGQKGSYLIFLGTNFISANEPGNLGKKSDVMNKKTTISVTIVDTLKETNWTSMTVFVREGSGKPKKYGPYSSEAEHHLDTIIYTLKLSNQ
jgi:hypothetical protein